MSLYKSYLKYRSTSNISLSATFDVAISERVESSFQQAVAPVCYCLSHQSVIQYTMEGTHDGSYSTHNQPLFWGTTGIKDVLRIY